MWTIPNRMKGRGETATLLVKKHNGVSHTADKKEYVGRRPQRVKRRSQSPVDVKYTYGDRIRKLKEDWAAELSLGVDCHWEKG